MEFAKMMVLVKSGKVVEVKGNVMKSKYGEGMLACKPVSIAGFQKGKDQKWWGIQESNIKEMSVWNNATKQWLKVK